MWLQVVFNKHHKRHSHLKLQKWLIWTQVANSWVGMDIILCNGSKLTQMAFSLLVNLVTLCKYYHFEQMDNYVLLFSIIVFEICKDKPINSSITTTFHLQTFHDALKTISMSKFTIWHTSIHVIWCVQIFSCI